MQEAWRLTQERLRELNDPEHLIFFFLMVVVQIRKSGSCTDGFGLKVTCGLKGNAASVLYRCVMSKVRSTAAPALSWVWDPGREPCPRPHLSSDICKLNDGARAGVKPSWDLLVESFIFFSLGISSLVFWWCSVRSRVCSAGPCTVKSATLWWPEFEPAGRMSCTRKAAFSLWVRVFAQYIKAFWSF